MKICPKCNTPKDEVKDYYIRSNGQPSAYCKKCFSTYSVQRWVRKKQEAVKYKGGICVDCKGKFEYFLYDFHHLDPSTKEIDWHKMRLYGWDRIKKELDKCVLLCCMCHRRREQKWLVSPDGTAPSPIA